MRRRAAHRASTRARGRVALVAAMAVGTALVVTGCGSSSGTTGSTSGTTAPREPQAGASAAPQPVQRANAAKGREPAEPKGAAGVCGRAMGGTPTLTIEPDVPSPRCMVVSPRQRLRVVNETDADGKGATIVVDFAGFHAAVPPGGSVILAAPLGTYLKPGSHFLRVGSGPGPAEIRLAG